MRFIGTIHAKVDQKGRAFLPAVFRRVFSEGEEERLILRKDLFENCLVIYPEKVWNQRLDELHAKLSVWSREQQQMFRQFVRDVADVGCERPLSDTETLFENGGHHAGSGVYRHGRNH